MFLKHANASRPEGRIGKMRLINANRYYLIRGILTIGIN
jgi:hypothetical protein